jgi:hypothetical protein
VTDLNRIAAREIVKGAAQQTQFCPYSGTVLGKKTTVVVEQTLPDGSAGKSYTCHSSKWDEVEDQAREEAEKHGVTLTVYDGRELW